MLLLFFSCSCPSHCNHLLNSISQEVAASRVSLFLTSKPQTMVRALYISALYLLHLLPNLAAFLSICSFFLSLYCCPSLYLNDFACKQPICSVSADCHSSKGSFWSCGISILTLKSHMDSHSLTNQVHNSCPCQVFKLSYHSTCLTFTFLGFSEFSCWQ